MRLPAGSNGLSAPVLLFLVLCVLFLLPPAIAWNPFLACRVTCNSAYLSCMRIYGNVAICNVAVQSCFARIKYLKDVMYRFSKIGHPPMMSAANASGKKRVILGLMTFGPDPTKGARITSLDEFKACLDAFQNAGYNEVDTAYSYVGGQQQAFTTAAGWKERHLKLATKYYPSPTTGGHDAENIRAKLEHNLKELATNFVDIFYLHAADRGTNFAETLEECDKLYKEGKFKELGISNFASFEVAEVVMICQERGWIRPTIYQGMYNAITRNLDIETIIACHRYGINVVVYNPLAGGLLSGKIKSKDHVPEDNSRFGLKSSAGQNYRTRYFKDATFEALAMIEKSAEKHGLTTIEIALRWCVHHSALNVKDDGGDGIIIGVSSLQQLEGNLKDLEKGPLPGDVVKTLDDAWLVCKATAPPYWHGELNYFYDTQKALFGSK